MYSFNSCAEIFNNTRSNLGPTCFTSLRIYRLKEEHLEFKESYVGMLIEIVLINCKTIENNTNISLITLNDILAIVKRKSYQWVSIILETTASALLSV